MRSTRSALLAITGLVAVFAMMTGLEVEAYWRATDEPVARAAVPLPPDGGGTGPAPTADMQAEVATILARPVLSSTRRPPATGAVAHTLGLPRLSAILVSDASRSAIFSGEKDAKPITATEGTRIGPYTVQSIQVGQVTVNGPSGLQTIRPSFAGGAASAVPVATTQPSILERLLNGTKPNVGIPGLASPPSPRNNRQ